MKSGRVIAALLLLAGGATAGRVAFTRHEATLRAAVLAKAAATRAPGFSELAMRDVQIGVWKKALENDPVSAIAMTQLAALHMQRARESGNYQDYITAEGYARKSLKKRTQRNGSAAVTLVSILLAQHRFTDARDVANDLVKRESDIPQYRSLLGEVSMEVGDYATASKMFDSVWVERAHLSNAPRLARWLELNNHVPEARRMLTEARDEAMARMDVAKEQKAWFNLRLGDLELRSNNLRSAEKAFEVGLQVEANDPRLMSAMARLYAAKNDSKDAIEWGERAIAEQLDPATLGVVGDAYEALGDTVKSNEYFHTLEVAVTQQPGAYHRAWSLYLLDHNLRISEVLGKAQEELKDRKDIYGYDIVAWALHKSGRQVEAEAMMKQALRLDTQDPLLARHQAAIKAAMPVTTAAR
ncbi:MAG: tetratricopeptide repeat protein [Gemmatimonadaceae bacterium]